MLTSALPISLRDAHEKLWGKLSRKDSGVIRFNEGVIRLRKHSLSPEDSIALAFAKVLEEADIKYAVVAGYVAILFGRGRRSDDIDFITDIQSEDEFISVCRVAGNRGFNLMQGDLRNIESLRKAYRAYLAKGLSVRFMYRNIILPNIEFKAAKTTLDAYTIENRIPVYIGDMGLIYISPLELQIAYKLKLGSEKDIGDAVFLYELFKERIDRDQLAEWCLKLGADCSILEQPEEEKP